MKTRALILLGFLIFSVSALNAQKISESKVPQDVVISFKYKYADAEVLSWEQNKDVYIAKFKLNDQEGKAEFNDKGVWNATKYSIEERELPTPILDYYKNNYRGQEFNIAVSELQKNNSGSTNYYLELRKEGYNQLKPVELTFDLSGKLLKKVDPEESMVKDGGKGNKDKNKEEIITETPEDNQKYVVDIAKVPSAAKTHYASKVKKASGSIWYLKDKIFTVKFTQAGQKGQSTYTKEGVWMETRVNQTPETLHQFTLAYLKENYRSYSIKSAELVTQAKDKSVLIYIFDKRSKQTPPPLTEIWFSPIGKFLSVTKPDVIEDDADRKRQEEKDNEFISNVDKNSVTFENANNYNDKVNFKELPTPIPQYIKQYYKEHYVKSSKLVSDDALGNVYLITVKLEDSKYSVDLYFDLQGKFLKKIDEAEGIINKNSNKIIEENKEQVKPGTKYGTDEEKVKPVDLPSGISKYLKKNHPQYSISESYFKTDNDLGNCYLIILKKSGDKNVLQLYFDLDGNLLKNETENE